MYPDSILQWLGYVAILCLIMGAIGGVAWYFTRERK